MSHFDPSSSDPSDANPVSSGQLETPRGGFMARPGLKAPPRHAVVVRQGDAPQSEHIPVARSSMPPPPPESLNEKVTVRAIPTPRPPEPETLLPPPVIETARVPRDLFPSTAPIAATLESACPPSDAPVVAPLADEEAPPSRAKRRGLPWLTILAAALAGLALGIISVVTTVRVREATAEGPAEQPNVVQPAAAAAAPVAAPAVVSAQQPEPAAVVPAEPVAVEAPEPAPAEQESLAKPAARPTPKRSIF